MMLLMRGLESSNAGKKTIRFASPIAGITQAPGRLSGACFGRRIVTILEEALNELAKVQTILGLGQFVYELRDAYGVANVAFHLVDAPQAIEKNPLLLVTYDEQWVERYTTQDYFRVDPIVVVGARGFLPVAWHLTVRMRPLRSALAFNVRMQSLRFSN